MRKRLRLLLTAAVMCVALFGASFTSFAVVDPVLSPSRTTSTPPEEVPDDPVPKSGYLTVEDETVPKGLVNLLDEDVPLASPQTGNGSVDMTVVLALLTGAGAMSLLIAGKKPGVALE